MADSEKYHAQVVLTYKKLLQDDSLADLIIKVGSDTIHAHSAIVCCRCPELLGFPSNDEKTKKKAKRNEVKLKDGAVVPAAMHKVLEFLYTGEVDFQKLADKEILLLVKAARYFKLDRLSYLCEEWLNGHMTIESVFHLLKAATDLDEERIKGFCLQFALKNYNDFIANKDGIYILGIELFQEVVAAFQTNPSPPASIYPQGGPPDTLVDDYKKLYEMMPYSDFSIPAGSENIRCHKALLLAYSDVLGNSLIKEPDNTVRISAEALKSMLKFSYYGYGEVEAKPACELVGFCRRNKLPTLLRICEDKIRNSVNADTVMDILGVSYLPADGKQDLVDELQSKCFPFILENLDKVDLTMAKAFNPLMTIDLLLQLQNSCKQNKYGLGCILNASGGAGVAAPPRNASPAPPARSGSGGAPVAAPRRTQPPPPSASMVAGVKVPPPNDSRPPPPPRTSSKEGGVLPPPVIGGNGVPAAPPRNTSNSSFPPPSIGSTGSAVEVRDTATESSGKGRLSRRKSQKDVKSEIKSGKMSKKDKKEEERRKKEEQKRIAKERKERQKMEKKFKGKGDGF
mmetsp:Transcript_12619/g.15732  ORF Transcript_12619/g.15732 Transcript_12619/m.15732 type:complete len:569 (-) Transcript_12619:130-1836(-)